MFLNTYHGKKVLVTGHTGFKGSWLSEWLLRLGAKVIGVSKDIPTDPALFSILGLAGRLEDHRLDIRQYEALKALFWKVQPEIVFHLAAQPIVQRSFDQPLDTFSSNLMGSIHVMEAARQTPGIQKIIMITSDKCYHNVEWGYGYRESDLLGGKDPYSASKACAEIAIEGYWHAFYQHGQQQLASARAGNVIGGGDWGLHRVVPDCMIAWSKGEALSMRHPEATRPWQHVLEPLSGYLWLGAMMSSAHRSQTEHHLAYNFGPDARANHSVQTLVQTMAEHWPAARWQSDKVISSKKEAGLLKLNCDKALHDLDWRATLNFEETVAMTSTWYQQFYAKQTDMKAFTRDQIAHYEHLATERQLAWTIN